MPYVQHASVQSGSGVPYISKLEALQEFASRAKMAGLQLHVTASTSPPLNSSALQRTAQQPDKHSAYDKRQPLPEGPTKHSYAARPAQRLILMDDLPQAHDASQRAALMGTLCASLSFSLSFGYAHAWPSNVDGLLHFVQTSLTCSLRWQPV